MFTAVRPLKNMALFCLAALILSGCKKSAESTSSASEDYIFVSCTFNELDIYQPTADVDSDFSEMNVPVDVVVTYSNCSGLPAGTSFSSSVDQLQRSSNTITMANDGYENDWEINTFYIETSEDSGCKVDVKHQASIDSGSNAVKILFQISFEGYCQKSSSLALDMGTDFIPSLLF